MSKTSKTRSQRSSRKLHSKVSFETGVISAKADWWAKKPITTRDGGTQYFHKEGGAQKEDQRGVGKSLVLVFNALCLILKRRNKEFIKVKKKKHSQQWLKHLEN